MVDGSGAFQTENFPDVLWRSAQASFADYVTEEWDLSLEPDALFGVELNTL